MTVLWLTLLGGAVGLAGALWLQRLPQASTGTVTVTLELDTSRFTEAVRRVTPLMRDLDEAARRAMESMHVTHRAMVAVRNPNNAWLKQVFLDRRTQIDQVRRKALGHHYWMGSMYPAYASPEDRDRYVQRLLGERDYHARSNRANRIALAVRFLEGWVERADAPEDAWWFVGRPVCERTCEFALEVLPEYASLPPEPERRQTRREVCGNCAHYLVSQ